MAARGPIGGGYAPPPPTSTRKAAGGPRQVPLWAFIIVAILAAIFAILLGLLWYYLQKCRTVNLTPDCPTILPITCTKPGLPPCVVACTTDSNCPTAAPHCNASQKCVKQCGSNSDCSCPTPTCTSGECVA